MLVSAGASLTKTDHQVCSCDDHCIALFECASDRILEIGRYFIRCDKTGGILLDSRSHGVTVGYFCQIYTDWH